MNKIFESGTFSKYRNLANINESISATRSCLDGHRMTTKKTVFLSHKHDELDELKDVIGFLQKEFDVMVYIDSKDKNMPLITSGETAMRIKNIIKQSDKFILLATEGAIDSKWCNWELGYGDALKYQDKIALLPIKPQKSSNISYKGNEYLEIYPYISYFHGYEMYTDGRTIEEGYYVVKIEPDRTKTIEPLSTWFKY